MPSGPELLILFLVVAVIAVLVFLARRPQAAAITNDTDADGAVKVTVVPAAAHAWLSPVIADLHALRSHSVDWLSHDVAIVTWTRRSGWAWVIAVFAFPFGLLALLFTTTEHGTIAVVDEGPPGSVAFGGQFSNAAVDAVNNHIPG